MARPRGEVVRNTAFVVVLHAIPVVGVLRGTRTVDWVACGLLYVLALVGAGLGLHRYFSHRAFKTSRWFQLALGVLACTAFTDPIGFAGKHRLHHHHTDAEGDPHDPANGFWSCWFGSLVNERYPDEAIVAAARDWARYPELRWLHRWFAVPALAAGALAWWAGGFSMFAIGFCLSRVLLLNASSGVNYVCHLYGTRRFATRDRSRNNLVLALATLGEGWHNNHHAYPRSARAGFRWWEADPLYDVVRLFAAVGLVWDVREASRSAARSAGGRVHGSPPVLATRASRDWSHAARPAAPPRGVESTTSDGIAPAQERRLLNGFLYRLYERRLLAEVCRVPMLRHLGLIQDGHRRYAREAGLSNVQGYELGAAKAEEVLTWCAELGIPMVTLWWLSTENLGREPDEVAAVLDVIAWKIPGWIRRGVTERLGIRIRPIGKLELLPPAVLRVLRQAEAATRHHDRLLLNIGVGYGGRQEVVDAVKSYLRESFTRRDPPEEILQELTVEAVAKYLYTYDCPDPDLIIRTSGEVRLSGFMLWQSAYSEFYFCDAYWPAFRKIDFLRAIRSYQQRTRRFGR